MIDINLVPTTVKPKSAHAEKFAFLNLPQTLLMYIVAGFVGLLVLLHAFLLVMWAVSLSQLKSKEAQWNALLPQKSEIDLLNQKIKDANVVKSKIAEIVPAGNTIWSEKLNILSDLLPQGAWLRRVSVSKTSLTIEGSAYTKQQNEITLIGNFVTELKNNPSFMDRFSAVELNGVNRVRLGTTEVAEFTISIKLK